MSADTKSSFYTDIKLIKLGAGNGKKAVYYLLESTPSRRVDNKYLLTSVDKAFTWKQIKK